MHAETIKAEVSICLQVLKLLLYADLCGCEALEPSVTGSRALSSSRIRSMSWHQWGCDYVWNRETLKNKPRAVKHCYQMFCNWAHCSNHTGRLAHPPVFWQLWRGSSALYPALSGQPAFSESGCRVCGKQRRRKKRFRETYHLLAHLTQSRHREHSPHNSSRHGHILFLSLFYSGSAPRNFIFK